ncbi:hypothetical protein KY358_04545 [Candidatus Woesearchaeota archaeon]|nr:hypothetical protein [Candidatus Woesearchaeota archaeon]
MDSISWCLKGKKGIRIIEPSEYICNDYLKRAEEDLRFMQKSEGHWRIITAYYACYDALYALLMKTGIKSEIHDCSIALMGFFPFDEGDIEFLKGLKDDRIQAQYYLKRLQLKDENRVKLFVLKAKGLISRLKEEDIRSIRERISKLR